MSLKTHIEAVHERKKTFKCGACNTAFSSKGNLERHIQNVHNGKKRFQCHLCNKNYSSKFSMNEHVSTIHDGKKCSAVTFVMYDTNIDLA